MIDKINFLQGQLTEAEEDLRKSNYQWASLQQRFVILKNELEHNYTPKVVSTTKAKVIPHLLGMSRPCSCEQRAAPCLGSTSALVKWRRF